MAELTELRRGAAEDDADGPVDSEPDPAGDARHHVQVVRARGEPGGGAAPAEPENPGERLASAHVHEPARGAVPERPRLLSRQHGRDVAAHDPPLPDRVLTSL